MHYGLCLKKFDFGGCPSKQAQSLNSFTSGKLGAELSQEKESDLMWASTTLGVSLFREKYLPLLINNQHKQCWRERK